MKAPLPTVDGVSPSCRWLPSGPWKTLLDFLQECYPGVEPATWRARLARGEVVDEAGRRLQPTSPYRVGGCIYYYRHLESESRIPFEERILYRDEEILVADKPHYLPVVPAGRFLQQTLLVRLKRGEGLDHLAPLHRLDRETAGVVLFSLNPATRGLYASMFRDRSVRREYEALAPSLPGVRFPLTRRSRIVVGEPFFRMREVAGEPNSETRIDVAEDRSGVSLYHVRPVSGRKHQIRLHFSALGMAIVHDALYPERRLVRDDDFSAPLKLLAKSISFRDPVSGRERHFESGRTLWEDDVTSSSRFES